MHNTSNVSDSYREIAEKTAVEEYLTCLTLSGVDNGRYLILKKKLENSIILRYNNYLKSREELLQVLNNYKD